MIFNEQRRGLIARPNNTMNNASIFILPSHLFRNVKFNFYFLSPSPGRCDTQVDIQLAQPVYRQLTPQTIRVKSAIKNCAVKLEILLSSRLMALGTMKAAKKEEAKLNGRNMLSARSAKPEVTQQTTELMYCN